MKMCRMIGFSFNSQADVSDLFRQIKTMAKHGKHSPHQDGWGLYLLCQEGVIYYRTATGVQDKQIPHLEAFAGLMHVRKASEGLPITFLQAQPFIDNNGKAFCHNGTIHDLPLCSIKSDSYSLFRKIRNFQSHAELLDILRTLDEYNYTSLNFLLMDSTNLIAYCAYRKNPSYYTLWYSTTKGIVVSSEPLNADFQPMENHSLLIAREGELIEHFTIG